MFYVDLIGSLNLTIGWDSRLSQGLLMTSTRDHSSRPTLKFGHRKSGYGNTSPNTSPMHTRLLGQRQAKESQLKHQVSWFNTSFLFESPQVWGNQPGPSKLRTWLGSTVIAFSKPVLCVPVPPANRRLKVWHLPWNKLLSLLTLSPCTSTKKAEHYCLPGDSKKVFAVTVSCRSICGTTYVRPILPVAKCTYTLHHSASRTVITTTQRKSTHSRDVINKTTSRECQANLTPSVK